MEKQAEDQLIQDVLNGERQRFAIIIDAYKGPVFNLAFRMTGSYSDAEDLAQETFLRAFENLARYDPERKFFTWLYTIALNLIRTHLRRKTYPANDPNSSRGDHPEANGTSGSRNPEALVIENEEARKLGRALLRLSRTHRELIVLRYYQGLSFEMIAELSGLSQSAAKMRVYRGLEQLRHLMKDEAR